MRLHNTLTGKVEEFTPLVPGQLGLYVCGVTPYAESHIGHAMSAIVYDVLVRYLRWEGNSFGGLEVKYVSNYTDVDDKLIVRGAELGIDPLVLAQQNIDQWEDEQRALGLVFPDERPRVTTHIPEIIDLIKRLVANGHAYATPSGDVYFRVRSDDDYGKLSHRVIEDLRIGTRALAGQPAVAEGDPGEGKEFAFDFALWKSAKPDEPETTRWPSPWGAGRPGWHIECSAMAQRYLGETFDIHGGGIDLLFPHHENEVAQSESATGQPFARLWMHNGLVLRDGEKMSKSLGNFVTVREALHEQRWSPDAIRLFVLTSHYRGSNNLTDEAMAAAQAGVDRLRRALKRESGSDPLGEFSYPGPTENFQTAMDDDLNTPRAIAALYDIATSINRFADGNLNMEPTQRLLRELACEVLGFSLADGDNSVDLDVVGLSQLAKQYDVVCGGTDAVSTIDALLAHREQARKSREFAVADGIRNGLAAAGVEIEDTSSGPRWSAKR